MELQLLFWLIVGHFVADFALQSGDMAKGKGSFNDPLHGVPWYYWMSAHCAIHAGAVALITQSILLGMIEFFIHFILDVGKCAGIISIHEDQFWHLFFKLLLMGLAIQYMMETPV
jgi:hypothetical protein